MESQRRKIQNPSSQNNAQEFENKEENQDNNPQIPTEKVDSNTSLNDQKKKDQSRSYEVEEDIVYHEEEEEDEIFQDYEVIEDRRLKMTDDINNFTERIKNNTIKIEELKKTLVELKEQKKKKQEDIMNLLSNKESIEEIYKNQVYLLNNNNSNISPSTSGNNNYNENTILANEINNLNNLISDNSAINLNSNHNITINDNELINTDEENFKIVLKEIKESDKKKYVEQVINMFEDIYKKKEENINNSIKDIIHNSYELFVYNNPEDEPDENNNELSVTNFFSKMSLFIANQSSVKFSESKINLLLRYLLKINYINTKLAIDIKFVNKKYKERKKEINDLINFLEKKNLSLKEKIERLERSLKELDENKLFFDKNDNDELSHEVVIEYEDGIDKSAEINYEDDMSDDEEIEKDNEMMNKGVNPYNKQNENVNNEKKKIEKLETKKNKQIIVKDNDESDDKYLNDILEDKKEPKKEPKKEIKKEIKKDNKKNNKKVILKNVNNNINTKNNNVNNNLNNNNNNSFNVKKKEQKTNENISISNQTNKSNEEKNIPIIKKINQNNINTNNIINLDKSKRLCPTPQHHMKKTDDEFQNLTTIEKDHYNRVQRIMNSGPKYGIFGVNKYNPDNSFNNKDGSLFSPRKNIRNIPRSSNKIDKTVKIESRQNHNFIGIISMTKVAPIKKKKKDNKKTIESKDDENDGGIKIINLEQDFNNEEEKEEEKKIKNNNINDNVENNNNDNDIDTNKNKNEVQGYYLNIINNKKPKNENNINNNIDTNVNNNNNLNVKEPKEKTEPSTKVNKLSNKHSYKSTRIRQLNLNDNNAQKQLVNKMTEVNNTFTVNTNIKNTSNNSSNNNDVNKKSHSLSDHQIEEEEENSKGSINKYNTQKIIMMKNANSNNSPNQTIKIKSNKLNNIPVSKVVGLGNKNYNANTYEKVNYKAGSKFFIINKNKK